MCKSKVIRCDMSYLLPDLKTTIWSTYGTESTMSYQHGEKRNQQKQNLLTCGMPGSFEFHLKQLSVSSLDLLFYSESDGSSGSVSLLETELEKTSSIWLLCIELMPAFCCIQFCCANSISRPRIVSCEHAVDSWEGCQAWDPKECFWRRDPIHVAYRIQK